MIKSSAMYYIHVYLLEATLSLLRRTIYFSSGHLMNLTGNKLNMVRENSSNREVRIMTSHEVIT